MKLQTELYENQVTRWPADGQHILANYDGDTIVVYQAYRPSIGRFAIENGYLGGPEFSLSRMSWIKPNFLWMMYRSGWGTKEGQEVTLGLRISRKFFDEILGCAVASSFDPESSKSRESWQAEVQTSDVRLQWDPDHSPSGAKLARRAVQLGLRGNILQSFAKAELLEVIDLSEFVVSQRENAVGPNFPDLVTPREGIYLPGTTVMRKQILLPVAQ
jgi:hypothetical protein